MKHFIVVLIFFLLQSCSKPKTVLICGNHVCVNNAEAEQFFEENLSIEVKIIDKKNTKKTNLIQLNLKENSNNNKQVNIAKISKTNQTVKTLSDEEVIEIKNQIKMKEKNKKIIKKVLKKNDANEKIIMKDDILTQDKNKKIKLNVNKQRKDVVDVCTVIKKCNIEEISKYLIEKGKKNSFPDITTRE
jgi:hypothetical protein|tara:strand:+ start:338 stop:901 length:564 start_codon:yes stop_codon:yes gene_type:complete